MAEHVLIDRYLTEFRLSLADVDEPQLLVDEVADHLFERVDQYVRAGIETLRAQRQALAEFGDPTAIGHEIASANNGGAAVPTSFTRMAGKVGLYVSVAYPMALILFFLSDWVGGTGSQAAGNLVFFAFLGLLPLAMLGTTVLAAGLVRRRGESRVGWIGVGLLAAGTVGAAAPVFWMVWPWLLPMTSGFGVLAWHHRHRWLSFAAVCSLAMLTVATMELIGWLPPESLAVQVAITSCFALIGLAVHRTAAPLAAEQPVDEPYGMLT